MKVLLVNKFHHVVGGSERYLFGLGEMLSSMGDEVIYFSMKDDRNVPSAQSRYFIRHLDFNESMGAVGVIRNSLHVLYSAEAKQKFSRLLDDEKPDIIHLNIFQSQLTASIVDAAAARHIPIVYTAHELKSICPNYQMLNHGNVCEKCLDGNYWHCFLEGCMKDSRAKSLLASMEAFVYKLKKTYLKMDLVITPSAFYKKKIEEAGVMRCPVLYMRNFLPVDAVYDGRGGDDSYFLYFGRLSREKGILTMIRAYKRANPEAPLYLAGRGVLEEDIYALIDELGLGEKVKILGFFSGEKLQQLIRNAKAVCLTSEWYENGPYSVMEAQACGRPLLVTDIGGLPELVEDGKDGVICHAGDAASIAEGFRRIEQEGPWDTEGIARRASMRYDARQYAEKLRGLYLEQLRNRKGGKKT
ncbi:MAG: glycosyltransferase [Lachnospiraceae bacterium]|nr:glycosyltransferase [Lachnospiraceae bacterium]